MGDHREMIEAIKASLRRYDRLSQAREVLLAHGLRDAAEVVFREIDGPASAGLKNAEQRLWELFEFEEARR